MMTELGLLKIWRSYLKEKPHLITNYNFLENVLGLTTSFRTYVFNKTGKIPRFSAYSESISTYIKLFLLIAYTEEVKKGDLEVTWMNISLPDLESDDGSFSMIMELGKSKEEVFRIIQEFNSENDISRLTEDLINDKFLNNSFYGDFKPIDTPYGKFYHFKEMKKAKVRPYRPIITHGYKRRTMR